MTTRAIPSHSHITLMQRPYGAPRFHFDENAPPPAPPPPPPPAAWHTGIDAEYIGHAQNKGWKLDDPKEAFSAAAKVARELEKHFGAPPERIVRLPAPDAKPEDLRAYYERIGAPKEAKDYDLAAIKDAGIAEAMRTSMHTSGVTKDAGAAVAAAVAKAIESKQTSDTVVDAAKLQEQKDALAKNWGDKFQYNQLQAIEGARRLGIDKDAVKALEGLIGYDKVMEAMRKIGAHTREDTFIERGAGGPAGDVTTTEGAHARKAELMADPAFVTKYNNGDPAAKREMTRLNQMITGVTA